MSCFPYFQLHNSVNQGLTCSNSNSISPFHVLILSVYNYETLRFRRFPIATKSLRFVKITDFCNRSHTRLQSILVATPIDPICVPNANYHRFHPDKVDSRSRFETHRFSFDFGADSWNSDFGSVPFDTATLQLKEKNVDSEAVHVHSDSETDGTHISDTQDRATMDVDAEVDRCCWSTEWSAKLHNCGRGGGAWIAKST
ncbi:hypothetical protein LXL04_001799 [Taraxacum kok-saghyz]